MKYLLRTQNNKKRENLRFTVMPDSWELFLDGFLKNLSPNLQIAPLLKVGSKPSPEILQTVETNVLVFVHD